MKLTKLITFVGSLFTGHKTYTITPVNTETTDFRIIHKTGVIIQIEKNGTVLVSSPTDLTLHAVGNLLISSDTHIGLKSPRIDLN